jgi:hypothetical protein
MQLGTGQLHLQPGAKGGVFIGERATKECYKAGGDDGMFVLFFSMLGGCKWFPLDRTTSHKITLATGRSRRAGYCPLSEPKGQLDSFR